MTNGPIGGHERTIAAICRGVDKPQMRQKQCGRRGQGYLRDRLESDPEFALRTRTSVALWGAAICVEASQQFGPLGVKLSWNWYLLITVVSLTALVFTAVMYPRLKPNAFIVVEQSVMFCAWIATAILVAASGGANSPYTLLFAFAMLYCAYFFRPRTAAICIATGSLAALAPFVYDSADAWTSRFALTISVTIGVFVVMCAMINSRKQALLAAEAETRRLSLTDPLTGVANIRASEEFAAQLIAECEGTEKSFGLMMVDLDGLKQANTAFGHAGGDEMLQRLARCLNEASGNDDQVSRIGGDEFSVLLPGATAKEVEAWSERFFGVVRSSNEGTGGARPQISASIGGAIYGLDGGTLTTLKTVADGRMYDHKENSATRTQSFRVDDTQGGRNLTLGDEAPANHRSQKEIAVGIGAIGWFLVAGICALTVVIPSARVGDSTAVLALSASCALIGLVTAAGIRRKTDAALALTVIGGIVVVAPGVVVTGAASSPLLAVAVFIAAFIAYFLPVRVAIGATFALLVSFSIAVLSDGQLTPAEQTTFSNMISIVIVLSAVLLINARQLARAEADAERLALIDPLTKVANRRAFEEDLATAVDNARAEVGGRRPALTLVDLDDFKMVNTTLGHEGGDNALFFTAGRLRDAVDLDGAVYRIGGDEFAVITAVANSAEAAAGADQCREAMKSASEDLSDLYEDVELHASCGFTVWRSGATVSAMVEEADKALQQSKDSGKDAISEAQTPQLRLA